MTLYLGTESQKNHPQPGSNNNFGHHFAGIINNASKAVLPVINDVMNSSVLSADGPLVGTNVQNQTTTDRRDMEFFSFIVLGVLGGILAILGLLGNTLSMVVLRRRQMRSSTSYYLFSLAIYDNGILLGMLFYFVLPSLAPYVSGLRYYHAVYSITIPVGYPLSLTAQMGSIYTCVGFTVERFIAVCRPLHAANTCTKSRTLRAILLIFIWSVLYNIPRFFHYVVYYKEDDITSSIVVNDSLNTSGSLDSIMVSNCTARGLSSNCVLDGNWLQDNFTHSTSTEQSQFQTSDEVVVEVLQGVVQSLQNQQEQPVAETKPQTVRRLAFKETQFGLNPLFKKLYLIYSQLFFMFLVPFLLILIMNIGLIRAVKKSKSMRQSMSASATKEQNMTVMLIAVIVVFLVCQFPTIVDNILVAVLGQKTVQRQWTYMCFYTITTFMVEINAASNFVLYCFFGKKFRTTFLDILGFKRKQRHVAYRSTVCKSRTNGTRTYDMEVSVM